MKITTALLILASCSLHALATEPAAYLFEPERPSFHTVLMEWRDPANKFWPSFFSGKPAEPGQLVLRPSPSLNARLTFVYQAQAEDRAHQRLLNNILPSRPSAQNDPLPLLVHLDQIERVQLPAPTGNTPKKNNKDDRVGSALIKGRITVADREFPISGEAELKFEGSADNLPGSQVMIRLEATLPAEATGGTSPTLIRLYAQAFAPGSRPLKR